MRVDYKALCKEYNQYVNRNDGTSLKVELTGFEDVHRALPGRNGVSTLLELQTRVLEVKEMHIETYKNTYVTLYFKTTCRYGHGFGSDSQAAIKIRDSKGKTRVIEVSQDSENEENIRRLESVLGIAPTLHSADNYEEFWKGKLDETVDKALSKKKGTPTPDLAREFSRAYITDLVRFELGSAMHPGQHFDDLTKLFSLAGYKLLEVFQFDVKESFTPEFVSTTKTSVEFGWHTHSTYNSLPRVLKVSKVKSIKTIGLMDIGVEKAGYYSHDDKMQVLPSQVKAAKRFAKAFKAKKNKVIEQVIREVA